MPFKTLKIPRSLIIIVGFSLIFSLLLASNLIPELRGDYGWRWPYETPNWPRVIPVLCVTAVYLVGITRIQHPRQLLIWCFGGAVIIPIACLYILGDPLYLLVTRTLSGLATGAHLAGAEMTDLGQTLHNWPQIMPTYLQPGQHSMLSVHIALSPPGLPLFYYGLNRLFESIPVMANPLGMALRPFQCQNYAIMAYDNAQLASAWFGVLMPVWAGLTVIPLYRAGGRLAVIWWPLVPSLALFTPTWNTFYPLIGLFAYLLLADVVQQGSPLKRRSVLKLLSAGFLVSLATFANVSIVPLVAFLGLYCVIATWQSQQPFSRLIKIGICFGIGLLSVWIIYFLISGVTPWAILAQALGQHFGLDRPYLPWIYLHLYDLTLFTGIPLVLLALLQVSRRTIDPLGVALIVTLIVLALSGTARGETGRVWLFFVPYILIVAARYFEPDQRSGKLLITLAQAITLITVAAFLRVIGTELTPPPQNIVTSSDNQALASPATFNNSITLVGMRSVPDRDGIDLTLTWRTDHPVAVPYYLSALIVKPDGQPLPSATNWQPFDTRYPMTCWQSGEVITETRHLPVGSPGSTIAPGNYWISLSMFDQRDGQSIPVLTGSAVDKQVGLGPISVP